MSFAQTLAFQQSWSSTYNDITNQDAKLLSEPRFSGGIAKPVTCQKRTGVFYFPSPKSSSFVRQKRKESRS
jgi:hypothetical protein